ncbi:MAG: hypothetical protein PSV18_04700 [Methylobacter sp.]|nr:hypothetical protein [Candidatus Methylobacter titanis]
MERIVITKGSIHLNDAIKHAEVTADIDTINADPVYGVTWRLHGKLNSETISGNGKAGAVLSLQHQTAPYPIMVNLCMGQTEIEVAGTLTKPTDLAALDMRLKLSGVSMGRLYALIGIVLPETPPVYDGRPFDRNLEPAGRSAGFTKNSAVRSAPAILPAASSINRNNHAPYYPERSCRAYCIFPTWRP